MPCYCKLSHDGSQPRACTSDHHRVMTPSRRRIHLGSLFVGLECLHAAAWLICSQQEQIRIMCLIAWSYQHPVPLLRHCFIVMRLVVYLTSFLLVFAGLRCGPATMARSVLCQATSNDVIDPTGTPGHHTVGCFHTLMLIQLIALACWAHHQYKGANWRLFCWFTVLMSVTSILALLVLSLLTLHTWLPLQWTVPDVRHRALDRGLGSYMIGQSLL